MGYATVQNLPRVHNYATAKQIHDNVKPIRGRSPELRPLGARKDGDTYSIRMKGGSESDGGGAVELVLYKTPVLTYHPDNTIEVKVSTWSTQSTHQMLSWVLDLKVNGSGARGKTVITMNDGTKHVIGNNDSLLLKMEEGKWGSAHFKVLNPRKNMGYRINRTRMGEVRKKYSEFTKYMNGFLSLRTTEHNEMRYGRDIKWTEISFSTGEAVDAIGTEFLVPHARLHYKGNYVANTSYYVIDRLPNEFQRHYMLYNKHTAEFLRLCENGQSEDAKHANFYKAMMILLTTDGNFGNGFIKADKEDLTFVRTIKNSNTKDRFDTIIKKYYRHEVLDLVELSEKSLPDPIYEQWMANPKLDIV